MWLLLAKVRKKILILQMFQKKQKIFHFRIAANNLQDLDIAHDPCWKTRVSWHMGEPGLIGSYGNLQRLENVHAEHAKEFRREGYPPEGLVQPAQGQGNGPERSEAKWSPPAPNTSPYKKQRPTYF